MERKSPDQPGGETPEIIAEKRRRALHLLMDFQNILGAKTWQGFVTKTITPEDQAHFWDFYDEKEPDPKHRYGFPLQTVEEAYAPTSRYGSTYLSTIMEGAPDVVAKLDELIKKINRAFADKNMSALKELIKEAMSLCQGE